MFPQGNFYVYELHELQTADYVQFYKSTLLNYKN